MKKVILKIVAVIGWLILVSIFCEVFDTYSMYLIKLSNTAGKDLAEKFVDGNYFHSYVKQEMKIFILALIVYTPIMINILKKK